MYSRTFVSPPIIIPMIRFKLDFRSRGDILSSHLHSKERQSSNYLIRFDEHVVKWEKERDIPLRVRGRNKVGYVTVGVSGIDQQTRCTTPSYQLTTVQTAMSKFFVKQKILRVSQYLGKNFSDLEQRSLW